MSDQKAVEQKQSQEGNDLYKVSLEGSWDISKAQQLKQELILALSTGGKIVVDLQDLERIDTSVMQLLVAFARAAKVGEMPVEWKAATSVFTRAIELLDLGEYFELAA